MRAFGFAVGSILVSMRVRSVVVVGLAFLCACGKRNFNVLDAAEPDASATSANLVFVTAVPHDGNLGGLAGADARCQAAAIAANLPGEYVAWLSTSTVDAITRLAGSQGWVRVDGQPVANRATDLVVRGPLTPIALSEYGEDIRLIQQADVFTGTTGTGAAAGARCSDWTSASNSEVAESGEPAAGGPTFTADGYSLCDVPRRLYCFGRGRVASIEISASPDPVMFVTDQDWIPGGGIASADSLCIEQAAVAGLGGVFRAGLVPTGGTMESRFVARHDYVRVDGVRVGRVLSTALPNTFVNVSARGVLVNGGRTWTGGAPGAVGADPDTCNNWLSTSPIAGVVGDANWTSDFMFDGQSSVCGDPFPIFCLED